jgi:hypothetical protein
MSNKSGVGDQEIKNRLESVMLPSLRENAVNIINSKSNEPISLFSSGKYISEFFLNRGQISEYSDLTKLSIQTLSTR